MSLVYYDIGAFDEPVFPFDRPENLVFLKKYIGIDPRFESDRTEGKYVFYNCVVENTDSTRKFYAETLDGFQNTGDASLLKRTYLHSHPLVTVFEVQCRRLSGIIEEQGGEIDVLKIDAHGSEMPILQGVEQYLKNMTAVNVEAWLSEWYKGHKLFDAVHEFLTLRGFSPIKILSTTIGVAVDLLYINRNADTDKINLVKTLYEVNDDVLDIGIKVEYLIKSIVRSEIKYPTKILPGKYLVLGGSGLVGSAVLSRLQNQEGVSVVSVYFSNEPKISANNIQHVRIDLRQRGECAKVMQGIDYVFHFASNIILRSMPEKEVVYKMTSNTVMNMNILESVYNAQIKKMLWMSSSTAYPPQKDPLVEDDVFKADPANEYFAVGWINRFIEKVCVIYSQKNENKFPIIVIRPTCIYGEDEGFDPNSCHLLPYLVRTIVNGESLELWDNGNTKKDFLHADDAAEVCLMVLNKIEDFEVFNLGCGSEYSVNEIIDMICELARIGCKIDRHPVSVVNERPLSLSKLNEALDFVPRVSMRHGLYRLVEAYKNTSFG